MVRKLDDILAELPQQRRDWVEARTMELATLKDLRQAALCTSTASAEITLNKDRTTRGKHG